MTNDRLAIETHGLTRRSAGIVHEGRVLFQGPRRELHADVSFLGEPNAVG